MNNFEFNSEDINFDYDILFFQMCPQTYKYKLQQVKIYKLV